MQMPSRRGCRAAFQSGANHLPDQPEFLYHDEWESLHHLIGPAFLYQP
jgi:hypothetical protein